MSAVRSKVRLYDLAKDLRVDTKRLIKEVRSLGVDISVPSNSISKQLADKIRDKYFPKKDGQNKRATKFLRTIQFSGPLPASAKQDPAPTENSPEGELDRTLVKHRATPIDDKNVSEVRVNAFGTLERAPDANRAKGVLESYGVSISPSLAPKTHESHGKLKATTSCRVCGYPCHRKKLNDHLLDNHPEEAFEEAARKLVLPKVTYKSFCELQRKRFGELRWFIDACLRGWQGILSENDQQLVTTDRETLFEYARILGSKISGGSVRKRQSAVSRLLRDIESYKAKIPARKLKWKLLPPGKARFARIVEGFSHLSKQRGGAVYDIDRLYRIRSLGPTETLMGIDEFQGYVAFRFGARTAMDCPIIGNAIYVFGENWKTLSRLTKSELLNGRRHDVERIVHKGDWLSRLRALLKR